MEGPAKFWGHRTSQEGPLPSVSPTRVPSLVIMLTVH